MKSILPIALIWIRLLLQIPMTPKSKINHFYIELKEKGGDLAKNIKNVSKEKTIIAQKGKHSMVLCKNEDFSIVLCKNDDIF